MDIKDAPGIRVLTVSFPADIPILSIYKRLTTTDFGGKHG